MDSIVSTRQTLRELLKLAGPLILSNLFFTVQICLDRLMLSWLDPAANGAAMAAAMLFFAPVTLLTATAGFVATFAAQYLGAGQPERVGRMLGQSLWICLGLSVFFVAAALFSAQIIGLAGHSENARALETDYFFCLCFSALPVGVNAAISGVLAGIGRPRTVIWINAVGCLVNGIGDGIFIFGHFGMPRLGIAGAGWATVAAAYVSMFLGLYLVYSRDFDRVYRTRKYWRYDREAMGQFLKFALPSGVQSCIDVIAWALFTLFVGRLGEADLAATSLVLIVNAVFFIPMLGMAQAVSVLVGQGLGEDRPDRSEHAVWVGFSFAAVGMGAAGITVALLPGLFLYLFQSEQNSELWSETAQYVPTLLWFVALYSLFDSANLIFAFALRGAGDTRFVSLATFILGVSLLIVPAYIVCENHYGLYWAWTCATIYIAGLATTFVARFLWGPWRAMRVIEPSTA